VRDFYSLVTLAVLLAAPSVWAERPHLRVRGTPRIDGHAGRSHGNLLLEGRVLDDAGTPVPDAPLALRVARAAKPAEAIDATPGPCGDAHGAGSHADRTDEGGRFCMWVPLAVDTYSVHLELPAKELLGAASADYTVDLTKRSVELRFDPEPRLFALDAPPAAFDAIAAFDDEGTDPSQSSASGLELLLENESGALVARATTAAQGRASYLVDPKTLGPPGRGALRVRYAGGADTMPSEHVAPIERDARVVLSLAKAIAPSSPEDGLVLDVLAKTSPETSGVEVLGGSVEARLDSVLVGAGAIEHGRVPLHVTFNPPGRARSVTLQLRYVPEAPWFQPAGELPVTVPIRGPSPFRQVPLVAFAVAVAVWLFWGRTARKRHDRTLVMSRPPSHEGTAGISVVKSSRSRAGIYAGRVVDAHEGTPVARARLSVEVPAFSGSDVLASVFADDAGEFRFELLQAPPEAQLVVEGPLHAPLRQPLPGAGVMEIALVLRRRKLLERLVQWAKRRGAPFDVRPEPTPAQVRRAAASAVPEAAAWADAVERAVYDRGEVDARVEAEVMALEPEAPKKTP
jgi:hypothetical protein